MKKDNPILIIAQAAGFLLLAIVFMATVFLIALFLPVGIILTALAAILLIQGDGGLWDWGILGLGIAMALMSLYLLPNFWPDLLRWVWERITGRRRNRTWRDL